MGFEGDEAALVAAAEAALGGDEVLAAAVFGWQDLVKGQIAGEMAGGVAGGVAGGGSGLASGLGVDVGGRAGVEAMAAAHDLTPSLLVAVTADAVHVRKLRGDVVGDEALRFDRSTLDVSVTRFGLTRVLVLEDRESGQRIALHGTAAPFMAKHKPDAVVLHLLAAPEG